MSEDGEVKDLSQLIQTYAPEYLNKVSGADRVYYRGVRDGKIVSMSSTEHTSIFGMLVNRDFMKNTSFDPTFKVKRTIRKIRNDIFSFFTAICLAGGAFTFSACSANAAESEKHLGLYAAEDGTLMKDGKPFYGFGVNYYNLINHTLDEDKIDASASLSALDTLASYNVRVLRFNLAGFYEDEWTTLEKREEEYFAELDKVADKAAELNIGLIPCLFFNFEQLIGYCGETPLTGLRSDRTETLRYVQTFTEKVVVRYAEHKAIYGWEFANEVNSRCDLPSESDDRVTTAKRILRIRRNRAE